MSEPGLFQELMDQMGRDLYGCIKDAQQPQAQMPFANDAAAQRRLAEIFANSQKPPSEVVLNIGPSMHTALVQIAQIVFGKLEGSLSHAELIAAVRQLKRDHDERWNQLLKSDEYTLALTLQCAELEQKLRKAEDMVARQAGELHILREQVKQIQPTDIENVPSSDSRTQLADWYYEILSKIQFALKVPGKFDKLVPAVEASVQDSERLTRILTAVNSGIAA